MKERSRKRARAREKVRRRKADGLRLSTGTRILTSGSETGQDSIFSGPHLLSTQVTPSPVLTPWLMPSHSVELQESSHEPGAFLVSSNS